MHAEEKTNWTNRIAQVGPEKLKILENCFNTLNRSCSQVISSSPSVPYVRDHAEKLIDLGETIKGMMDANIIGQDNLTATVGYLLDQVRKYKDLSHSLLDENEQSALKPLDKLEKTLYKARQSFAQVHGAAM